MPTYLLNQGITYKTLVLGGLLSLVAPMLLILLIKKLNSRRSWVYAIITYALFIILIVNITGPFQFWVAKLLGGAFFFFYFLPYNIAHFQLTPKENVGESSAIMFGVSPFINIAAPLAAGFIAGIGTNYIWAISIGIGALCLFLASRQVDFEFEINLKKSLKEIEATRWLIFIEGIWEALIFTAIPVFTLFFIKSNLSYAIFGSYLAATGALANFALGKVTDKIKRRSFLLYPITFVLGITTILFVFAIDNIVLWIIATGIISFILPLFWNLSTAIVVDTVSDLKMAMPGREFLLAVGRTVGCILVLASLLLEHTPKIIFPILATAIFVYPFVIFWNSKIKKRFTYL
jgi:MFS family permease